MISILQHTGNLLAMSQDVARLPIYRIEDQFHRLDRDDISSEQWVKVNALADNLAVQHPDHRLWQKVISMKEGEVMKRL